MSSSDNPQLEPQASVSVEAQAPIVGTPDPFAAASVAPVHRPAPVENPAWSGWDVLLIALLTLVTLMAVELLTAAGAQHLAFPHSSFGEVLQKPILGLLSEFLSYIAVAGYMIMLLEGKYHEPFWRAIRWNWHSANPWFLGLGMLTVLLDMLGRYLPLPKTSPFDEFFAHPTDAYLTAAFAVTVGPLMEEVFFRGFLYPVLARRTTVTWAVLLTAMPFGLIHFIQYRSWAAVLLITLVGVVLGAVRAVTKSVAASFLVHVGYNATVMTLMALATDGFRHMPKALAKF